MSRDLLSNCMLGLASDELRDLGVQMNIVPSAIFITISIIGVGLPSRPGISTDRAFAA
jgi:hypothetical protein